jgi:hypothetical protein
MEEEDLDTSWIAEQERFQNIQNNYRREPMESIELHFIYINKNQYIDKIINEQFIIDPSNLCIKREQLLKIIQDKKLYTPFSKYRLIDILTFFVDLEPENIQSYSNVENIDDTYSQFLKVLNIPDEINIPQSIFIFHSINSIYFIFQEVEIIKRQNTTFKSILKKDSEINVTPLSQKSTKKVRIETPDDKKQQRRLHKHTRKLIPKNNINV